jgi:hypothetical protein
MRLLISKPTISLFGSVCGGACGSADGGDPQTPKFIKYFLILSFGTYVFTKSYLYLKSSIK